eukprot:1146234-Pelagomonas_calceolata.AAC.4
MYPLHQEKQKKNQWGSGVLLAVAHASELKEVPLPFHHLSILVLAILRFGLWLQWLQRGGDLQPGNLAARPAQLFQLHRNIHEFGNKTISLTSLLLQEMKDILRACLRTVESA